MDRPISDGSDDEIEGESVADDVAYELTRQVTRDSGVAASPEEPPDERLLLVGRSCSDGDSGKASSAASGSPVEPTLAASAADDNGESSAPPASSFLWGGPYPAAAPAAVAEELPAEPRTKARQAAQSSRSDRERGDRLRNEAARRRRQRHASGDSERRRVARAAASDGSRQSTPQRSDLSTADRSSNTPPSLVESDELVEEDEAEEPMAEDAQAGSASDDDEVADAFSRAELAKKPKHWWRMPAALRSRELGVRPRLSADSFRHAAVGSLHMVERMELMYKMNNHDGCVNCLHFNASGTRLASGSDDTRVTIWDWAVNQPLLAFDTHHQANVFQAKFMPLSGDCHIATCSRDGQVRLAELSVRGVCKSTRRLAKHRQSAHKLAIQADSPHVVMSCGEDAVVFECDLRESKPNKLLLCKDEQQKRVPLYSINSHPIDSRYFAVSGQDSFCRVYDRRFMGEQPVKSFRPHHLESSTHKPNVTCLQYNYNGTELLASYNDDDIYAFDTRHSDGADYVARFGGHRNNATVKGVNWYGPKSEFVVSGSDCGHVYFWERRSSKIVQFMMGDEGGVVNCLEPHPTSAVLATSGLDHDVKIWVPSCEEPQFDAAELEGLTRRNRRARRADHRDPTADADFIYFMLRRYMRRQMGRRRGSDAAAESDSSDDADEMAGGSSGGDSDHRGDGDGDGDDDEDEENRRVAVSCRQS